MRECPVCGASNGATDDFCGNCGSYLGWSEAGAAARTERTPGGPEHPPTAGRPTEDPASRTSGPAAESPHAPSTGTANAALPPSHERAATPLPDSSRAAADSEDTGAESAAGATGTSPRSAPPRATPEPPGSGVTVDGPTADPPSRSTAGPTPGRSPAPAAPRAAAPQPVKPAKAVAPRAVVRPVAANDTASGVPCPACGTPNPPHRRFCRSCAAPLTPVAASTPLPWWRTVWPLRRRARAGSGRLVRLAVTLAVVVALCAGGFLLLPAGRNLFEDTRDKLGRPKAVTPARVTATAQLPGHPADDTTDGLSNRYWAVPGSGASVTYTFGKPFRLVDLIITNGASKSAEKYAEEARALQMDMEVTVKGGHVHRKPIALSDKAGPQTVSVGISDVTAIRLTLSSPAGLARGRHIALAEVEFFQRG
ncbi:zinc ribbon domain-containing protein [Streptomyces sp. NPDC005794]|uniref:NADase-type glycan-binding domain-containing protein n=1 Tax=Streptomyces sp. NPDC005794 TaxID=3364733 RepID=UPI0036AF1642